MPKVSLTEKFIKTGLKCPEGKTHTEYCDQALPGFIADVQSTSPGACTFKLRYKSGGKTAYTKIGRSTEISLADARREAKRLKAEIALGRDPQAELRQQRQSITLQEFLDDKYLPYVQPRKRSIKNDESMIRLRIGPTLGHFKLNRLTRHQIMTFHNAVLAEGLQPATADHHIKILRHALNLAVDWNLLEKNPATRVPLFLADNKVERFLDDDELQRLLKVLATDSNRPVCQVISFLLYTGARVNEALSAQWSDINLENRVWGIRSETAKSKKRRSIPLNDAALEVLDQLGTKGKHNHLFISSRRKAPLTTIAKVWDRLRNAADLPKLRLHDLRHNYASMLVNSGRTLYEVQHILGHSDPQITQRYAHLSTQSLQEAANSVDQHLEQAKASS
ncbi:DUF4102 domain-containing protein [Halieaceae bacterium IMCC14734]|uniref:DUF4102 domain-containing protein n=1 Tax=Candidatus Litorirhabdus singularis TaxID=2518993 RepID=A0ABT3TPZ1_9GAMM|nr:site-specific integrase [Candidatus Litorirhabdus singularis]MCX2983402.1 DUF4102 domain-containing protein [Candidatus Litorirhabdus singularis]